MYTQSFIEILIQKTIDNKVIIENSELLKTNKSFIEFCENNQKTLSNVSTSAVGLFLLKQSIKMVNSGISIDLVKNVYNPYSVIFALLLNSKSFPKSLYNKLSKIFFDICCDSSNYDIIVKDDMKHSRSKVITNNLPMEFFWIIPLMKNPAIITQIDLQNFIDENIAISAKTKGYVAGYEFYVINFEQTNKEDYKQFLLEGATSIK